MSKHKVKIASIDDIFESNPLAEEDEEEDEEPPQVPVAQAKEIKREKPKDPIEELGPQHIEAPDRVLLLGPCQSGKTSLIRNLIRIYMIKYEIVAVYWYGETSYEEKWLPKGRRRSNIDTAQIDALRNTMKDIRATDKNKYAIIVLDDVIGEGFGTKWHKKFIANCRHQGIIVLIGMQYLKALSPTIRENVQRIYVTSPNNQTMNALYELSREMNKYNFFGRITRNLKMGQPTLLDFTPNRREVVTVRSKYCTNPLEESGAQVQKTSGWW